MTYAIEAFGFIRWNGPPPQLVREHVRTFNKPGQPGTSAQLLGIYGDPFEVELVAAFESQYQAALSENNYRTLIGSSPAIVLFNNVNYFSEFSHKYLVLATMVTDVRALPRMIGQGYDYAPGWQMTSRWTMLPVT